MIFIADKCIRNKTAVSNRALLLPSAPSNDTASLQSNASLLAEEIDKVDKEVASIERIKKKYENDFSGL
jgi:hypothetical protein